MRFALTLMLLPAVLCATLATPVRAATPEQKALDEIWAMEAKIYAGRASGTMQPYMDAVSKRMLSFPFGAANPVDYSSFIEMAKKYGGDKERNQIYLKGFYLTGGNTAVIFTRSHRTVRPDGKPVDEYYDTTHIYAREGKAWKLMSSINRPSDNKDVSSPRPPLDPRP